MRLKQTEDRNARQEEAAGGKAQSGSEQAPQEPSDASPAAGNQTGLVVAFPYDQTQPAAQDAGGRLLDRQIQAAIGSQLRMLFNDLATSPVPDRLVKLIEELDARTDKS